MSVNQNRYKLNPNLKLRLIRNFKKLSPRDRDKVGRYHKLDNYHVGLMGDTDLKIDSKIDNEHGRSVIKDFPMTIRKFSEGYI